MKSLKKKAQISYDTIVIVSGIIIILAGAIVMYYILRNEVLTCTSDPVLYYTDQVEKDYAYQFHQEVKPDFRKIKINFYLDEDDTFPSYDRILIRQG